MKFDTGLLSRLVTCYSPSGKEHAVRELIAGEIRDYVDTLTVDTLGNLIAHKKGSGRKLMFSAHMDQIGLVVTEITDKGMLKFGYVGGMNPQKIIGQRMVFENGVCGVVCTQKLEDLSRWAVQHLHLDIGADSREEAEAMVQIGDVCVYTGGCYENDNYVFCPSADDKIGCCILIEAIKRKIHGDADVYYAFTVQEEVGCRGAQTAAFAVHPDLFVAVDITPCGGGEDGFASSTRAGAGVAVKLMDVGLITHPEVKEFLLRLCRERGIRHQLEAVTFGGTDAMAAHMVHGGVASGVLSIPTRNSHSANEIFHKGDAAAAVDLVAAVEELYR